MLLQLSAWAGALPHVPVDALGVGPVGFEGYGGEAVVGDEALRDGCAGGVEFGGAVGGVAEEDDAVPGEEVEVLRE